MLKIKIKTESDNLVHYDRMRNMDTLCGLYALGDPTLKIGKARITREDVNCPECLKIVMLCQSIPPPAEAKGVPDCICKKRGDIFPST